MRRMTTQIMRIYNIMGRNWNFKVTFTQIRKLGKSCPGKIVAWLVLRWGVNVIAAGLKPESRWELSKRTKAEIFEDFPPLEQNTLILLTKGLQCSCLFQNGKEIFPEKRPRLIWSISFAYRRSAVKGLKYISCIVIQLFIHISYTDCNTILFTYVYYT